MSHLDADMPNALADLENTSMAIRCITRVLERDRVAMDCEGGDVLDNFTAGGLLEALRIATERLDDIGDRIAAEAGGAHDD